MLRKISQSQEKTNVCAYVSVKYKEDEFTKTEQNVVAVACGVDKQDNVGQKENFQLHDKQVWRI